MTNENEDKKIKIMLVDDDDFLVDMYSAKFASAGIDVLPVKNGVELIERLKKGEVSNLILLDIVLPQMDGIETLEQIRKEGLASGIPIVMLTNQNDDNDMARTTKLGVDTYIVKASATPSEVVDSVLKKLNEVK